MNPVAQHVLCKSVFVVSRSWLSTSWVFAGGKGGTPLDLDVEFFLTYIRELKVYVNFTSCVCVCVCARVRACVCVLYKMPQEINNIYCIVFYSAPTGPKTQ